MITVISPPSLTLLKYLPFLIFFSLRPQLPEFLASRKLSRMHQWAIDIILFVFFSNATLLSKSFWTLIHLKLYILFAEGKASSEN